MGFRHHVFILILVIGATWAKDQKSFSIFNVVQFKNAACISTSTTMSSGNRNGTCYTSEECEEKKGKAEGNCASGFGVCCVFIEDECGTEIDQNNTYIQNEDYPTAVTAAGECEYKIKKCDDAICTVRLDFEQFKIESFTGGAVDESTNTCTDTMVVTVSPTTGLTLPTICGSNAGQHMYIELGTESSATATVKFTFTGTGSRTYEIRATQYRCDSSVRPPEGCLQYHTGVEGRLTTFNWEGANGHLQSQNYKICIRQEMGFCCNKYSICESTAFGLYNVGTPDNMDFAKVGTDCAKDYLLIEASSASGSLADAQNRYCGGSLNDFTAGDMTLVSQPITDCTSPFQVGIVTDALADGANDANAGVCLNYVQVPC